MKIFYSKKKATKKEILNANNKAFEQKKQVKNLSERIQALAIFIEKINTSFDNQLKNISNTS